MLTSGDVVDLDFGLPTGREAGFDHPVVVVTSQRILDANPSVIHVIPLTSTVRDFQVEVVVDPDPMNGLAVRSSAQCQHIRAIAPQRIRSTRGTVGPAVLGQVREVLALVLDLAGVDSSR